MRIIPAVLLFIAAGISTASAQDAPNFAMDHGNAAAAAAAAETRGAEARAKADAIRNGRPLTPSQSTDFGVNGGGVVRLAPPRTPEQQKAEAEARAAWQVRCQPVVVTDRDGLRRTQYAEPNCDLSRLKTAGGA
jgi:hypothetical protein